MNSIAKKMLQVQCQKLIRFNKKENKLEEKRPLYDFHFKTVNQSM